MTTERKCAVCFQFTDAPLDSLSSPIFSCSCGVQCCGECMEEWILSNTNKDVSCVGCRAIFPQDIVYTKLRKEFLSNQYRLWRAEFLWETEKAFLGNDMILAQQERQRRELGIELDDLRKQKKRLLRSKKLALSPAMSHVCQEIKRILAVRSSLRVSDTSSSALQKNQNGVLLLPCPTQDCRGLIHKATHSCLLCQTHLCRQCHQPVEITNQNESLPHECLRENMEAAALILRETKPCPRCAIRIYKISGCDQMWCVGCHCAFSWESGRPLESTTVLHNPHYYHWLFEQPHINLAQVDMDARDPMFATRIMQTLRQKQHPPTNAQDISFSILRKIRHIAHIRDTILPVYLVDTLRTNQDARVRYLLHDMDDSEISRLLYHREKRNLKKTALYTMFDHASQTMENLIIEFAMERDWKHSSLLFQKFRNLIQTSQVTCTGILQRYGGRGPSLTNLEALL